MLKELYSEKSEKFYEDLHQVLDLAMQIIELNGLALTSRDKDYYLKQYYTLMGDMSELGTVFKKACTLEKLDAHKRLALSLELLARKHKDNSTGETAKDILDQLVECSKVEDLSYKPEVNLKELSDLRMHLASKGFPLQVGGSCDEH